MDGAWPEGGHRTRQDDVDISRRLLWNVYAGGIAALTAIGTKKALDGVWKVVTGDEPPDVNDPATPPREALAWAAAMALGLSLSGVFVNRLASHRWEKFTGEPSPARNLSFRF